MHVRESLFIGASRRLITTRAPKYRRTALNELRGNFLKYKGTRTKEPPSQETRPKIKKTKKTGEERSLGYEYKADMQQILSI